MKCVSSDPETTTCDRCQRLHRNCVYELHRRGQWLRDHTGRRAERQHPPPEHAGGDQGDLVLQIQRPGLESRASGSYSVSPRSEQSSFTPGALDTALDIEGSSDITMTNGFDIQQLSMEVTANMPTTQDPIELGLISERAAQVLYETFFRHFNPIVGLLDPSIYTFQHTRTQSSFLLTVILTVASKILPPGLYESLRNHTEALLGRALLSCDTGIETVWAIVCMYHWKDADDTMWKQQATEMLDRVASKYFAAMGNPEGSAPSRVSVTMAAQGRLLGAIGARLNPGPRSYIPTPALLQEDMNPYGIPNDISTLSGFLDFGDLTLGEGHYTAPLDVDSNMEFEALDDDFVRSRYHEAG
jgi:hypothetical protein